VEARDKMKAGIIADTHDNLDAISKAVEFFNHEGIEILIHAGDFVAPFTEKPFRILKAPLVGIFGNNDGDKLLLKEKYKEKGVGEIYEDPYEFELTTKKIIVTHKPKIVKPLAMSGVYDVVIYGHTHEVVIEKKGNKKEAETLVINPGECCGYLTGRKTVAILDLEKEEARILEL
jgi:putative phosphoesterase